MMCCIYKEYLLSGIARHYHYAKKACGHSVEYGLTRLFNTHVWPLKGPDVTIIDRHPWVEQGTADLLRTLVIERYFTIRSNMSLIFAKMILQKWYRHVSKCTTCHEKTMKLMVLYVKNPEINNLNFAQTYRWTSCKIWSVHRQSGLIVIVWINLKTDKYTPIMY